MTMAVTRRWNAAQAVLCASTGNTSASAAAYAARAGINCVVLLPKGEIAMGKLTQAVMDGATIVQIAATSTTAWSWSARSPPTIRPSRSSTRSTPTASKGRRPPPSKSATRWARPRFSSLPVGNAGNITAYWKGYTEYHRDGLSDRLPRMLGTQAAGAAPLVLGEPVKEPETIATAIRIGSPASWTTAVEAQQQSDGRFLAATDEEILWRLSPGGARRGGVRRACIRGQHRRPARIRRGRVGGQGIDCRLHGDRQWAQGPRHRAKGMPTVTPLPVDPSAVVEKLGLVCGRRSVGDSNSPSRTDGDCSGRSVKRQPRPWLSTASASL